MENMHIDFRVLNWGVKGLTVSLPNLQDRTQQRFEEQPVQSFFPELQNLPSK